MSSVPETVIIWGVGSVLTCAVISTCIICLALKNSGRRRVRRTNERQRRITREHQSNMFRLAQSDQNNIYNISGSVQGQNQHAYPDAYLSIDHIAITNELNKPPPKYDDAPPSYEEALKLAMAHSNSLQTYQSEQGHSADLPRTHLPAGSSID
ncbi:uncharacterized protein LOC126742867 isoform X1 [Anthonomus grandis grandis]|uniref:uncharacterized protein LOC126742867 isoform X1 n=1 Tax=Anthonomus grandis grandis TaxID=2921223 RepID=UPI002166AFDC|nr:uncharacterized protein LOC126742867 isoform X1 [Anthonomus grandis grandis]